MQIPFSLAAQHIDILQRALVSFLVLGLPLSVFVQLWELMQMVLLLFLVVLQGVQDRVDFPTIFRSLHHYCLQVLIRLILKENLFFLADVLIVL